MQNRIALVTGAGRGIGRACAVALAAQGAKVAVTARSEDQLASLVDEIQTAGGTAMALAADLTDRAVPGKLLDQVRQAWGPVEILVNNAGVGSSSNPKPLVAFDDDFWDLTFAINVTAPYLLTKLALPAMIERGWGRIINIASINAKVPSFHGAAYTASKHAVAGLAKAAALETAGTGVTVNSVCPGVTRSLMNDKRLEYDAARTGTPFEDLERQASPLGRRLEPDEIAAMVAFLATDAARAITGQSINVCGGRAMC